MWYLTQSSMVFDSGLPFVLTRSLRLAVDEAGGGTAAGSLMTSKGAAEDVGNMSMLDVTFVMAAGMFGSGAGGGSVAMLASVPLDKALSFN